MDEKSRSSQGADVTTSAIQLVEALQMPKWKVPNWFTGIRLSTQKESESGIDAYISTDIGIIPLRVIKTMPYGSCQFERELRKADKDGTPICTIAFSNNVSLGTIRMNVVTKIQSLRKKQYSRAHRRSQ